MIAPVLVYHKIDHPTSDVRLRGAFTSPQRFAKQMAYLKRLGFIFYTASDLIEHYRNHGKFPRRGIAVTFDDGWKDNYTNAFPILRELGVKATIFLVSSCIGKISSKVVADGEREREHLSREEIIDMSRQGVEFGSHTMNHRLLYQLSLREVEYEVMESKRHVEELLQRPCQMFAYPAGFFNASIQKIVKKAGYRAAFSTMYGPIASLDLYGLNRIEILRRDRLPFQFAHKMKSLGLT